MAEIAPAEIERVTHDVAEASYLLQVALAERSRVARQLRKAGHEVKQIARMIGVSPQRVSKILDGNAPPRRKRAASGAST